MYLTKSDFVLARSCPTKLFYRKSGLRPESEGNEYLRLLAEGGFMVEEIARQLHPGGRLIGYQGTPEEAARRTAEALCAPDVTLFEATLIADRFLARVDVLVKRGGVLELIEVKSGSFDGEEDQALRAAGKPGIFRGKKPPHPIRAEWRPYLEDVAFQTWVARQALPHAKVRPFLMLADTSRTTGIDGLWEWFSIERSPDGGRPLVRFTGDAARLRDDHFLAKVEVSEEVGLLLDEVAEAGRVYVGSLFPELKRIETPLSLHCKECELHEETKGGARLFPGCWGELSEVRPNLFELYHVGTLGGTRSPLANRLIAEGRVRLFDVEESHLVNADGQIGSRNQRQLIQLRNTRLDRQWVSEELPALLDGFAYPLRFVDFETSALAVPYHAGMRPYETVAFQWSCHTLQAPGAAPLHREWINAEDAFPNRAFAESLRAAVGDGGTVFMWATHERTTLRTIRAQLQGRGEHDAELAAWMEALEARLVDMNDLTLKHYFHPRMRGKTSLKAVAEAVWSANESVRAAFPEYQCAGARSPYQALPSMEVAGEPVVVREGTGAIRAYQAMLYGAESRDPEARRRLRELLLQYCRLDTAAMVMVWMHWRGGG
jgi:hypothetical protein